MKRALTLLLIISGCTSAFCDQPEILVSAAASLTDVLTALVPEAQAAIGARVALNFGGSGALRRQIEQGAPVDVFFSAAAAEMDALQKAGLIIADTRANLLSNSLVLIGPPDARPAVSAAGLRPLLSSAALLAIGNPDSVPAGRYAREALEGYGLFALVQDRLVLGSSVRDVLRYVASGSAPLAVVFLTDVLVEEPRGTIRRLFTFPAGATRTPILYPVAVVSRTRSPDAAARLVSFLGSPRARAAFTAAGFTFP